MRQQQKKIITDIGQIQSDLPEILERANSDPSLGLGAAVNPLLVLEDMGYALSPEVAAEIEERSRFSTSQIARRRKAIARIREILKEEPDLSSAASIGEILEKVGSGRVRPDTRPVPQGSSGILSFSEESLRERRGEHPIFGALLDLRILESSSRRFAPRQAYEDVRAGKVKALGLRVRFRLSPKAQKRGSPRPDHGDA